jgi:2-keto-3-deoxy-L-arabinonate dehydratase
MKQRRRIYYSAAQRSEIWDRCPTSDISRSRCQWRRAKLRDLIAAGGSAIEGPWDGEEAITLLADLDDGATGAMTGGGYPDGIRQIIDPFVAGLRDDAVAAYTRRLPLINYENRQCGLNACKALMREGGVIGSEAVRHPLQPLHPSTRAGLIEIARRLDPLVLRWGK